VQASDTFCEITITHKNYICIKQTMSRASTSINSCKLLLYCSTCLCEFHDRSLFKSVN